jgi:hypothetical protein
MAGSSTRAARTSCPRQSPACVSKDSIAHQSGRSPLPSQSKLAPAATRTVAQDPAFWRIVERHDADLPDVRLRAHRRCHERQRCARQRQTGPHLPSSKPPTRRRTNVTNRVVFGTFRGHAGLKPTRQPGGPRSRHHQAALATQLSHLGGWHFRSLSIRNETNKWEIKVRIG